MTDRRLMADPLEPLRAYLEHREVCGKWAPGWWDDSRDCTCGLEAALVEVSERTLGEIGLGAAETVGVGGALVPSDRRRWLRRREGAG